MTGDRWHITRDTWQGTGDTWYILWDEHSLKFSAPWLFCFGMDSVLNIFPQTMTWLLSHKAVYRTAPASPGLLNIMVPKCWDNFLIISKMFPFEFYSISRCTDKPQKSWVLYSNSFKPVNTCNPILDKIPMHATTVNIHNKNRIYIAISIHTTEED